MRPEVNHLLFVAHFTLLMMVSFPLTAQAESDNRITYRLQVEFPDSLPKSGWYGGVKSENSDIFEVVKSTTENWLTIKLDTGNSAWAKYDQKKTLVLRHDAGYMITGSVDRELLENKDGRLDLKAGKFKLGQMLRKCTVKVDVDGNPALNSGRILEGDKVIGDLPKGAWSGSPSTNQSHLRLMLTGYRQKSDNKDKFVFCGNERDLELSVDVIRLSAEENQPSGNANGDFILFTVPGVKSEFKPQELTDNTKLITQNGNKLLIPGAAFKDSQKIAGSVWVYLPDHPDAGQEVSSIYIMEGTKDYTKKVQQGLQELAKSGDCVLNLSDSLRMFGSSAAQSKKNARKPNPHDQNLQGATAMLGDLKLQWSSQQELTIPAWLLPLLPVGKVDIKFIPSNGSKVKRQYQVKISDIKRHCKAPSDITTGFEWSDNPIQPDDEEPKKRNGGRQKARRASSVPPPAPVGLPPGDLQVSMSVAGLPSDAGSKIAQSVRIYLGNGTTNSGSPFTWPDDVDKLVAWSPSTIPAVFDRNAVGGSQLELRMDWCGISGRWLADQSAKVLQSVVVVQGRSTDINAFSRMVLGQEVPHSGQEIAESQPIWYYPTSQQGFDNGIGDVGVSPEFFKRNLSDEEMIKACLGVSDYTASKHIACYIGLRMGSGGDFRPLPYDQKTSGFEFRAADRVMGEVQNWLTILTARDQLREAVNKRDAHTLSGKLDHAYEVWLRLKSEQIGGVLLREQLGLELLGAILMQNNVSMERIFTDTKKDKVSFETIVRHIRPKAKLLSEESTIKAILQSLLSSNRQFIQYHARVATLAILLSEAVSDEAESAKANKSLQSSHHNLVNACASTNDDKQTFGTFAEGLRACHEAVISNPAHLWQNDPRVAELLDATTVALQTDKTNAPD